DRLKSDFFSNVSHELRTPLTLVQGPLDNLLNAHYGALNEKQKHSVETIHLNSLKLGKLVDELLDFARLESGKMKVRWQREDLCHFLRLMLAQIESAADTKSLKIVTKLPKEKLEVFCDPEKVETIVLNLLSNALKYTPAGGKVTVTLEDYPK